MTVFNFETIIALLFLAISIVALLTNRNRKKKLGEIIFPTLSGIKHSDFIMQMSLIAIMMVFVISSIFINPSTEKNLLLFYIVFPVALVIYFINTLYQTMAKKGFYENGIYTSNGVLFYKEITKYDIHSMPRRGVVRFRINPRSSLFSSVAFVEVNPDDESKAKSLLKKYAQFKKNTYSPPPKKKKK